MNKKILYIFPMFILALAGIIFGILLLRREIVDLDIAGISKKDCVPYNVFIMKGENDFSVDITWSTKADCLGFIVYGRDRGSLNMIAVDRVNKSRSQEHIVTLEQLLTTETYYFLINSQEQAYGKDGVPLEFVLEDL